MGAAVALDEEGFKAAVGKDGILLVDWWATWCGPCRTFAPIYEEVAAENPDLVFAKVDTDAQQNLAGAFGIQSIPTLMVFRDRVLLFSEPGVVPKEALRELLTQVRGLDMEKVKAEIAAEVAKEEAEMAAGGGHHHDHDGHDHDHDHDHDHGEQPSLIIKP